MLVFEMWIADVGRMHLRRRFASTRCVPRRERHEPSGSSAFVVGGSRYGIEPRFGESDGSCDGAAWRRVIAGAFDGASAATRRERMRGCFVTAFITCRNGRCGFPVTSGHDIRRFGRFGRETPLIGTRCWAPTPYGQTGAFWSALVATKRASPAGIRDLVLGPRCRGWANGASEA